MLKRAILLGLCLMASTTLAANYGKITGQVLDSSTGDPLPGANVIIEGTQLGAAADVEGKYVIIQVPPGIYTVYADVIGYSRVRMQDVKVQANRIAYADFDLQPQVIGGKELTVIAERPVIEKDITATTRNIDAKDIDVIPSTTVTDVLRTQPGVVTSGGFHMRGGRSGEVTFMVDGIPVQMTDPFSSNLSMKPLEIINRNAISEMQVISGTYSAEYGNSMSGVINITTKEGSNTFNGSLNAKSSGAGFEETSQDYNRMVIRGDLSGPLLSEKTSFFISGSFDDRDHYLPWGYNTENTFFAKLTDRHINNLKISLSLNTSDSKRKGYSHRYKYIPDQYWYEPASSSNLIQLGLTHTLAKNLYYTLNVYVNTYTYTSGDYDYNDLSPAYALDENKEFYRQSFISSPEEDDQQTLGIKADMLWQANQYNEFKAGFEVRRHSLDRFYISSPYYDDHTFEDYVREPVEASAFIQDKINFSSIILSAGLRFDLSDPNTDYWPSPYDAFYERQDELRTADVRTQLSPRLGISYPVSDKTVFHFGYGHYFQKPAFHYAYKSMTDQGYAENVIMNLRTGNGRFGNPDLKPERTIAYEFGLSHQLWQDYLMNVSVYSKKITNLVGGRTFFAGSRADIWESYSVHINDDFAYNNGLEIQFRKMRGRYFTGEINYTYAVAEGSSSGPMERVGVEEANRQTLKFFPLDFDQRHTINGYLALQFQDNDGPVLGGRHILEHFSFAILGRYGSGLPYTKGIRGATEPYEINNARLPENWSLDLKINRRISMGSFHIEPYLEIYNVTDRRNVVYVDPFTGEPDYSIGRTYEYAANPLNWGSPRIIYSGIEFMF
ncbi:TonB-dependent receptor [candidate division KSB1 bacterium]|nr:TonB-dependent receptor [candidate division KSB1 bacterium]